METPTGEAAAAPRRRVLADEAGGGAGDAQRAGDARGSVVIGVEPAEAAERYDLNAARLRSMLAYQHNALLFQVGLMAIVGAVMLFFFALHDTPPELMLRKLLFGYVFAPLYAVSFALLLATRNRYEVSDLVRSACFILIGFGTAYVFLAVFNSVLLALDMSARV